MSNILFISPQPLFGGAAVANMSIAQMLQEDGHVVVYNDEYRGEDQYDELKVYHYDIHKNPNNRNENLLSVINELNSKIGTVDCIIWGDVSIFIYFLSALKKIKKMGIRQIAVFHSLCLEKNIKTKIVEYVVSYSIKYFDYYVFVSDYTRKSWSKYRNIRRSPSKLKVIFNPMKAACVRHEVGKEDILTLGFVGRFSDEKQPEKFCALSKESTFNLIAFGEGPLLEPLKRQYPDVSYMGLCKDAERIYQDIDVLVMTSKFENCPMVILEAKTRGIPCVAPNVGGIPEIVKNGIVGVLYDEYTTTKILNAINDLVGNYSSFSQNCIESAESTYPSALVKKWRELL